MEQLLLLLVVLLATVFRRTIRYRLLTGVVDAGLLGRSGLHDVVHGLQLSVVTVHWVRSRHATVTVHRARHATVTRELSGTAEVLKRADHNVIKSTISREEGTQEDENATDPRYNYWSAGYGSHGASGRRHGNNSLRRSVRDIVEHAGTERNSTPAPYCTPSE